jgi:membrane associated rhomboid family serine protease
MAWHERHYNRQTESMGFSSRLGRGSVVTWLLGINAAVFVLDAILSGGVRTGSYVSPTYWGNFNVAQAVFGLQVWRFVTYQFLHDGFLHILFNMIALFFFGPLLEQWWGSRRFLAFYVLCGISGAFVVSVLSFVPQVLFMTPSTMLVGASGSIFGILVGAAVLYPHQRVMLLFPPIPMSMRTMALVFLGISVLSLVVGTRNAGGDAAHLGGALLGLILVKRPKVLDWVDHVGVQSPRRKHKRLQRRLQQTEEEEAEVDRILDKVRQHGLQSLNRREKKVLNRATERSRQGG